MCQAKLESLGTWSFELGELSLKLISVCEEVRETTSERLLKRASGVPVLESLLCLQSNT